MRFPDIHLSQTFALRFFVVLTTASLLLLGLYADLYKLEKKRYQKLQQACTISEEKK